MNSSISNFEPNENQQLQIKSSLTTLLFEGLRTSIHGTIAGAVIMAIVMWPVIEHNLIITWLFLLTIISTLRVYLSWKFFQAKPAPTEIQFWETWFFAGTVIAGMIWGLSGWILFAHEHPFHQAMLTIVLTGMCAGGLSGLSAHWKSVVLFQFCVLTPLAFRFLIGNIDDQQLISFLIMAYLLALTASSKRINNTLKENVSLSLQSQDQTKALKENEKILIKAQYNAEQASRAKSEFLSTMSHEIRTPMNGVIGMAQLLQQTNLDEIQKSYVDVINKSGHSLISVIDDILDYSSIETGKIELNNAPFNLHSAIKDICHSMNGDVLKKQLELILDYPPDCPDNFIGDTNRFQQVLINLIGNAIKFTQQGKINIDVNCSNHTDNNAILDIRIKDTGIGISEEDQKNLFAAFSQVDTSSTRKYGGSGLGLVISKRLIELMQGQIGVESTLGEGSVFWIKVELQTVNIAQ